MKLITISQIIIIGHLFLVMVPNGESFKIRPNFTCIGSPVDIVFVLDSSSSIWGEHFLDQLNFVNYLVEHLDIGSGPKQVRVGVETFSDTATVHLDLDNFLEKKDLQKKIEQIPQIVGNTSIGDALRLLRTTMFTPRNGERPDVKHVAVIITDGASQDESMTHKEALKCRNANIELVVIGIGDYIKRSELQEIASKPNDKYLFYTPTHEALDQIRNDILKHTCKHVIPEVACKGKPADIVFVLDSSSSIWREYFQKQLDFVKYMVDHLDYGSGPKQVRIGVETFSDYASVHINLNDFFKKKVIKWKIDQIPQILGNTSIGEALRQLRKSMFTLNNGARPDVRHIAVILTDGTSQNQAMTQKEARECRNDNIELWVIGIGNYISRSELKGIASKPKEKHVFYIPSYEVLNQILGDIIKKTCHGAIPHPVPTTEPLCNGGHRVEVIFLIHHIYFGDEKTHLFLQASDAIIKKVGTDSNFRFGVIFDKYPPKQDVTDDSMIGRHHTEGRHLSDIKFGSIVTLMKKLRNDVFLDLSLHTRRVGLVFLDNTIDLNSPELLSEVKRINFELIDLYAVLIGAIDQELVEKALAVKYRVIRIFSYDDLIRYLPSIFIETICEK